MIFLLILAAIAIGLIIGGSYNFAVLRSKQKVSEKMARYPEYRDMMNGKIAERNQRDLRKLDKAAVSQKLYEEGKTFSVLKNEIFG